MGVSFDNTFVLHVVEELRGACWPGTAIDSIVSFIHCLVYS